MRPLSYLCLIVSAGCSCSRMVEAYCTSFFVRPAIASVEDDRTFPRSATYCVLLTLSSNCRFTNSAFISPSHFNAAPSFVSRSNSVVTPRTKQVVASASASARAASSGSYRPHDLQMMPIGVPKVAYRVPGSQSADW
jgi:hypothetical protein